MEPSLHSKEKDAEREAALDELARMLLDTALAQVRLERRLAQEVAAADSLKIDLSEERGVANK